MTTTLKASATGGYLGVFFMGATLVITSFTCTAPIVGSLLANVAQFGTARVAIGMAIFGATMALPFVFLSLMPGKVKAMPRSGEWMDIDDVENFDASGNLFRTWGTGVLLGRYFAEHRPDKDAVLSEIEAERVRAGLRAALELLEPEQLRTVAEAALRPVYTVEAATALSRVERWSEAVAATLAELPAAWTDAAEETFLATLKKYR